MNSYSVPWKCFVFGHSFPKWKHGSLMLTRDYDTQRCRRCGESEFGTNPFEVHGGAERFYVDNHTFGNAVKGEEK